jgi:hypothetical protein
MPLQNPPIRLKSSRKFLVIFGAILLLTISLIVYFRYYYVYSDGTRVGVLYKFSRKGSVFKTYEGEIMLPGIRSRNISPITTNTFTFSVTDEVLAKKLTSLQGQELEIHYKQYNNSLVWRGENYKDQEGQYIVDRIEKIINKNPSSYGL